VVGFFAYSDIELLIKTKYEPVGYFVFNFLAKQTLKQFAQHFSSNTLCNAIAIDDVPNKSGYSHTAILTKALTSDSIRPVYNALRAKNRIEYAGKSKEFRLNNPRDFIVCKKPNNIILIDDVMTTGSTLTQAYNALDGNVDFAMVLCI
jgi:competence protein ComFC